MTPNTIRREEAMPSKVIRGAHGLVWPHSRSCSIVSGGSRLGLQQWLAFSSHWDLTGAIEWERVRWVLCRSFWQQTVLTFRFIMASFVHVWFHKILIVTFLTSFFYRIAFLKFVSFNNLGGLFKYGCFLIPSYQCQSTCSMCSTTSTSIWTRRKRWHMPFFVCHFVVNWRETCLMDTKFARGRVQMFSDV